MVTKAPSNYLSAIKSAFHIKDHNSTQGTGRLCLPACSAFAGICLSIWFCWLLRMMELKSKILDKLLDSEVPDLFKVGKPDHPVVLMSTEL
jgi:hypothetical protein